MSENANGAESSNPEVLSKFAETCQRGTGSEICEPEQKPSCPKRQTYSRPVIPKTCK